MALTKLDFTSPTGWNDTIAFPENPDDSQVRPLLQQLHDETKAYLNNVLTAEIEGTMATKSELAGVVAGGIPAGTISVEMLDFDPTEQPEFDIHLSDYVRNPGYALSTGSLNAYAIAVTPAITSYIDGMSFKVKWHLANTAASYLNVCGLGPIQILDSKGNVLTAEKLKTVSTVVYYNGNFILQGEGSDALTGDFVAGDLLAGKTGYSNNPLTKITGTMQNWTGSWATSPSALYPQAGSLGIMPAKGFFPGTTTADGGVLITDENFIPSNILSGKTVLGQAGTAKRVLNGSFTATGTSQVVTLPFTPAVISMVKGGTLPELWFYGLSRNYLKTSGAGDTSNVFTIATNQFTVTGLTNGQTYTWDAHE